MADTVMETMKMKDGRRIELGSLVVLSRRKSVPLYSRSGEFFGRKLLATLFDLQSCNRAVCSGCENDVGVDTAGKCFVRARERELHRRLVTGGQKNLSVLFSNSQPKTVRQLVSTNHRAQGCFKWLDGLRRALFVFRPIVFVRYGAQDLRFDLSPTLIRISHDDCSLPFVLISHEVGYESFIPATMTEPCVFALAAQSYPKPLKGSACGANTSAMSFGDSRFVWPLRRR